MDYRVRFFIDNTYEVYSISGYDEINCCDEIEKHYQGSLSDCDAWIRLTNDNRM